MIKSLKKILIFIVGIENFNIFKIFITKKRSNRKRIHIIGDSHVSIMNYINKSNVFKEKICAFPVEAATIQGLVNPNSKTDAFKYFKRYLFWNVKKEDYFGILLGEVDCGFVIWYRMEKYKISIEEQLNITIQKYEEFILFLHAKGVNNIVLFSIPLPTIKDNEKHSSVANLRSGIRANQKERTKLTLRFNKYIHELAIKYELDYVDYTTDTISQDTGLIMDSLLNKSIYDHHMDNFEFSKVLTPYLEKYLRE